MALTRSSGRNLKHNILDYIFLRWSQHIMDKKPLSHPIISAKPSLWVSLTQIYLQWVSRHSVRVVVIDFFGAGNSSLSYSRHQTKRTTHVKWWHFLLTTSLCCLLAWDINSSGHVSSMSMEKPGRTFLVIFTWSIFIMSTNVESKPLVQTRWRRQSLTLATVLELLLNVRTYDEEHNVG